MQAKLLGNSKKGLVFVVSAPAGTGKTTLVSMLTKEFDCIVENISYTTRPPRSGEISGVHYNFASREEFEEMIAKGEMLEYVSLYGYYYGTAYKSVRGQQEQGKHVVLVIDTQGALQLKLEKKFPAAYIFLLPPSVEELRKRLTQRRTESPDVIEVRMKWAEKELEAAREYDYQIINDDLATAYEVLKSIFIAEEHRSANLCRDDKPLP